MTKVFVETHEQHTEDMFVAWGYEVTDDYHKADLIVFTGGTDVNPLLYGEMLGKSTDPPDVERDARCVMLYNYARANKVAVVGICRGAQFVTVMQGGSLHQHITGHDEYIHLIMFDPAYMEETEPTEGTLAVTSDHHQAMHPIEGVDIIARSDDGWVEATVFSRNTYASCDEFCVQGHPEWVDKSHPFQQWFMGFLNTWMV